MDEKDKQDKVEVEEEELEQATGGVRVGFAKIRPPKGGPIRPRGDVGVGGDCGGGLNPRD